MKTKSNPFLRSFVLATTLAFSLSASAAIWQWDGGAGTDNWQAPNNWNPNGANNNFNGTFADRLNVNGTQALAYTVTEGTTNYGTAAVRGLAIGSGASGSGTMNITGGTFSSLNASGANSADVIGNSDGNTGTLNISGGTFIGASTGTSMNLGGAAASGRVSNLTISGTGSATLTSLLLNGVTINVNLNGGTLELNGFTNTSITAAAKIRLNGGTLKARQANPSFIAANALLETLVQSGGAVIDTNSFDITIAEPLLEDATSTGGGIIKNSTGLLTLTQPSTTTGVTDINAGGLALKAGAASWAPSSFSHSGNLLNFDLGVYSPSNPVVINTGALTVDSAVTVNVTGSNFQVGQIPLINYTSKSITGSLTLNTATLPVGVLANLVDNGTNQIYLDVTQAASVFNWSGTSATPGTGDWDTSSLNWNTSTTAYSTATSQIANFPDITGGGTVNITAAYSPLIVNISNLSGNPYTFNGTGKITGSTVLNKSGTGRVTFANGTNDYSGATTISAGAIVKQAADSTTGNISVTTNGVSFALDGTSGAVSDGSGQTLYIAGAGIATANYFFDPVVGPPAALGSQPYRGALQSVVGSNTWAGDIVLTSTANTATTVNRIGVQPNASITLTGNISENVTGAYLLFRAGAVGSTITLGGAGTYSYTSETQMYSDGGAILLGNDNKLPTGELLNFGSGGATVFDLNGYDQEFAGVYGGASGTAATITNNGSSPSVLTTSPVVATTLTSNAFITNGTESLSVVKNGDGTQVLGYANTYTGTTTVNAGILRIDGDQSGATGAVQVNGGSLGGIGTIGGAVTVGALGSIAPGVTTGTFTMDSADLSAGGTLAIDLNDAAPQQADLLSVNNALNVSNAKLVFNVTGALTGTSYQLASATTITGTILPANVTGLPSGYTLVQTATEIRLDQATASPYETWGTPYGLTAGSEAGDLDNDGLTNFEEFAFGLIPNSGSSVNPITVQLNKTSGQFTYQRLAASGLTYTVWTSTNLTTWTQDTTATQSPTAAGANESVLVTLSATIPLAADKLFVRVKAQ